jgi:hypothetical protein
MSPEAPVMAMRTRRDIPNARLWYNENVKRLLCFAALALNGCHGRQSPDDTFRAFTVAVLSHQTDSAWNLLSHDSQDALTDLVKRAAAESPKGQVPSDPKAFLFGEDAELARPVKEIKIKDQGDKLAHLDVTTDEGTHPVTMVSENGGWKLDLTDGLKP